MSDNTLIRDQAIDAKAYANSFILHGTTQLKNNQLKKKYRNAHTDILVNLRSQGYHKPEGRIDLLDKGALDVELTYALSSKYNTGNCHELALLALDYFLNKEKNTRAEVYHIFGGDHVFLVVNRKNGSTEFNPDTWGDDAYFCDPWSDAVYPAKDYLARLKNYYRRFENNHYINAVEPFDPSRHKLEKLPGYDTDHLYVANYLSSAKNNTMQRFDQIKNILADTLQAVNSTIQTILLTNKHEETLLNHLILKNDEIVTMIHKLQKQKDVINQLSEDENFHVNYEKLVQMVKDAIKNAIKVVNFTYEVKPAEPASQAQPDPTNVISRFRLFFQKAPKDKTQSSATKLNEINNINQKMAESVSSLKQLVR